MELQDLDKKVSQAWEFLQNELKDAKRKDGTLIIDHSWRVAECLYLLAGMQDPDALAAALLHDVVEMGKKGMLERIRKAFGNAVADRVSLLTKDTQIGERRAWEGRLARIEMSDDIVAKQIAWADRRDGLRCMAAYFAKRKDPEGFAEYLADSERLFTVLSRQKKKVDGINLLKIEIDDRKLQLSGLKKRLGIRD